MSTSRARAEGLVPSPRVGEVIPLHTVRIGEDAGREALLVDGVVQSISPHDGMATGGYWAAMVPDERPRRALFLGLGGGTVARLLQARFGNEFTIVGVDNDPAVLHLARAAGWLPDNLEVIVADVFEFVQATPGERFDYVAIDLFRGEEFVGRALNKTFLRRVRALMAPRGRVVINLFRDRHSSERIERIGALFDIQRQVGVGGNVVIHARRIR
jgi:spermidine synthase